MVKGGGLGLLLIEWVFEDRGRGAFLIIMVTLIKILATFLDHEILLMIAITF